MSHWLNGPLGDHSVWMMGIQVFWWKGIFCFAQLILAGVILFTLLDGKRKMGIATRLREWAKSTKKLQIRSGIRLRMIAAWTTITILLVSLAAAFAMQAVHGWKISQVISFTLFCSFVFATVVLPPIRYIAFAPHAPSWGGA